MYRWAIESIWIPFLAEFPYQRIYLCRGWCLEVIALLRYEFGTTRDFIRRNHPARIGQWRQERRGGAMMTALDKRSENRLSLFGRKSLFAYRPRLR